MGRCNLKKTFIICSFILFTLFFLRFYNDGVNHLERPSFGHQAQQVKPVLLKKSNLLEKLYSNHSVHPFEEQIELKVDGSILKFKCGEDGIVTVKSGGRLGNQMGEYATLLAIALRDEVFPILQHRTHTTLTKYFDNISIPSVQILRCPLKWNYMNLRVYNKLNKTEKTKLAREGIYIDGYPTSVSMFHRYRAIIQKQFKFKNHLIASAQTELRKLTGSRSAVTFIGVHVRRTDYREFLLGRYNGQLVGEKYFKRAMDYYRQRYPRRLFVVTSDDMDWCQNHLEPKDGDIAFAGNRNAVNPGEDMALLASCNHSIITYGNFGFWSAYLAGGETILCGNNSKMPTELQHSIQSAKIDRWQFFPGFS